MKEKIYHQKFGEKSSVPENELEMQKFFLPISRFSTFSCWHSVSTYIFKCFVVSISWLTTKEKSYHQKFGEKKSSGTKNEPELQKFSSNLKIFDCFVLELCPNLYFQMFCCFNMLSDNQRVDFSLKVWK
jgi:hypothetical protein